MTLPLVGLDRYLRAEGCTVELLPGWETRGHDGTLNPEGGLLHHTAGHKDLAVVLHGRVDLAGPLANLYVRRNGHVVLVAAGVAWHAGPGSAIVYGEILREQLVTSDPSFDAAVRKLLDNMATANSHYIGVEVENDGHEPLTPAQLDALPRLMAACVRFNKPRGWRTAYRWRHHRQHTHRKVDMAHRGDLWTAANARLKPTKVVTRVISRAVTPKPVPIPAPAPPPQEDDDMRAQAITADGEAWYAALPDRCWHISDQAELAAMRAAGTLAEPVKKVTPAQLEILVRASR